MEDRDHMSASVFLVSVPVHFYSCFCVGASLFMFLLGILILAVFMLGGLVL